MSGSLSILISLAPESLGLEEYIIVWFGEASGDLPGVNFLAGMPRLPLRSERLFLRSTRLIDPLRLDVSGL